jgi:hypothetical protein
LTTSPDILVSFAYYGAAFYKYLPELTPMFKGPYPYLVLDLLRIPPLIPAVLTLDPAVPTPLLAGPFDDIPFLLGLIPPGCITFGFIF